MVAARAIVRGFGGSRGFIEHGRSPAERLADASSEPMTE
jgi:hypothetical protein